MEPPETNPDPNTPQIRVSEWEFDSHLDVTNKGQARLKQVWARPSRQWDDTREWTLTEDTPGKENPPADGCGHWASTYSFKKAFPHFER